MCTINVQRHKTIAKCARQHFSTTVNSWRILCSEQHEVGVRSVSNSEQVTNNNELLDGFLGFCDKQLTIVVEQTIERLKHLNETQ